ncbi:partial DNA helicase II, partial [Rhodocyclaceae bacterium]
MSAIDGLLREDGESRQRALELGSFIVEAPAGAGKTELLTQRVLRLLAVVEEPEEIVAITFTTKAAAEMKSRIVASLARAAAGDLPAEPHKRITFDLARAALAAGAQRDWRLLENPGRLRITTIDALCASLARQMPLLSR